MLNRRLLRIKAMQALYAFKQAEKSGYDVARDLIGESFEQLALVEGRDIILPEKQTAIGVALFDEAFKTGRMPADIENPEARREAAAAFEYYLKQLQRDRDFVGRNMVLEAEKIYKHYVAVLALTLALAEQVQMEEDEKAQMHIKPAPLPVYMLKLHTNTILQTLRQFKPYEDECIRQDVTWEDTENAAFVRKLYRDSLKNDERYQEYVAAKQVSIEEDEKILRHIAKNIILKNELTKVFFEEDDLTWNEDRDVIFSMVSKTFKSAAAGQTEMAALSPDWVEDRQFFRELYSLTLSHEKEHEPLIAAKLQNWDMSRVASTDSIMLHMALTEMLYFPSIPVKATINEYLELAKVYSTPQSKQFINGVLDALSAELIAAGRIKKSGRGLIDNQ